jgi:hypothetical protein
MPKSKPTGGARPGHHFGRLNHNDLYAVICICNQQTRMEYHLMAYYRDEQLQALYDTVINWIATVTRDSSKQIADLYSDDAILLGTVAENIKIGRRMIEAYFDKFVINEPECVLDSIMVKSLGNYGVVNGSYTFTLNDDFDESGRIKIPARFTFVIDSVTGLIVTHHSSSTPRNTNI